MKGEAKGITPLISLIVLVVLSIGVVGAAFVWVNTLTDQSQERAEGLRMEVKNVGFDCSQFRTEITVRNTGDSPVSEDDFDVFVNGDPQNFDVSLPLFRAAISL